MRQTPRAPETPLLDAPSVRFIVGAGVAKALLALTILGLVPRLGYELETARATTFHFMAVGQLLLTYPARHTWTQPLPNPYLHAAVLGGIGIQVASGAIPAVAALLGRADLPLPLWGLVFGTAALTWAVAEGWARTVWKRK
jgi:Ca2+-transporting ATPase